MKLGLSTLVTLLFTIQPAIGGPDDTTQFLLSDPVSMLDLGVFKADLALKESDLGFMEFSWDTNRFVITTLMFDGFSDAKTAEDACAAWVAKVRALGSISPKTGMPYGDHSTFARNFSHEGFARVSAAETIYTDLDRLFDLSCTAYVGSDEVVVTAPLLGTSYSLQKDTAN